MAAKTRESVPAPGLTVAQLAIALGIQERTIYLWLKRGCPRLPGGKIDKDAALLWRGSRPRGSIASRLRVEEAAKVASGGGQAKVEDPANDWHARKERADALLAELKLEQGRGDVIARVDVAKLFVERCVLFRRGLERLARKVAPRLVGLETPAEALSILSTEHRQLLDDYSRDDPVLQGEARRRGKSRR